MVIQFPDIKKLKKTLTEATFLDTIILKNYPFDKTLLCKTLSQTDSLCFPPNHILLQTLCKRLQGITVDMNNIHLREDDFTWNIYSCLSDINNQLQVSPRLIEHGELLQIKYNYEGRNSLAVQCTKEEYKQYIDMKTFIDSLKKNK